MIFFVDDRYVIEFDGEQHQKPIEFFGGEEKFLQRKNNDIIKNKYCFNNNILIIRIPYQFIDKISITDLQPETSKFLLDIKGED